MYDDIKHFCSHNVSHAARHFIDIHILLITTTKLNNLMFQKERYVGIETITTGGVSLNIFHEYEQIPLNAYQPILFQEYQLVESWGLEEAQLAKCNVNAIKVPTDRHHRKLIKTSSFRHLSCPRERRR